MYLPSLPSACWALYWFYLTSNYNNAWTPSLAVHSRHVIRKPLWWWGGWTHWIAFMTSLYMCIHTHTKTHTHTHTHIYIYIYINWKFTQIPFLIKTTPRPTRCKNLVGIPLTFTWEAGFQLCVKVVSTISFREPKWSSKTYCLPQGLPHFMLSTLSSIIICYISLGTRT